MSHHCSRLLLRLERLAPAFSGCAQRVSHVNFTGYPGKYCAQNISPRRHFQLFTAAKFAQFEVIKELDPDQKIAVRELRNRIEDILPRFKNDHARHDLSLFKFLKSKDFDLDKTEEMIRKHIEWRTEKDMDNIMSKRVPPEIESDFAFKVTGFNKMGYPVIISNIGRWELKKALERNLKEEFLTYILQMFEQAALIGEQISSKDHYVGQMHLIFDMDGFGLRHLASPEVIQAIQEMIRMLQDNYPGSTSGVQIIQAPRTFQFLWSIIQGTLSERTRNKTDIIGGDVSEWQNALLEHIDPDNLPSQFGGAINTCFDYKLELGLNSIPQYEKIPEEEMSTTIIPGGGTHIEEFDLSPDTKISWNFKTALNPINFKVNNGYDGEIVSDHEVSSNSFTQRGLIHSEAGGKYTLHFANTSCSRETLNWAVRIHEPHKE